MTCPCHCSGTIKLLLRLSCYLGYWYATCWDVDHSNARIWIEMVTVDLFQAACDREACSREPSSADGALIAGLRPQRYVTGIFNPKRPSWLDMHTQFSLVSLCVHLREAMYAKPRDTRQCTASSTCPSCVRTALSSTTLLLFHWTVLCFVYDKGANKLSDKMCLETFAPAASLRHT